jgi:hypothetical protein
VSGVLGSTLLMAAGFGGLWLRTLWELTRVEQERDALWDRLHGVPSTSEGEGA